MEYVIGIDLGTSSIKALLVNEGGEVCREAVRELELIQERPGYSEQNPEQWVAQTIAAVNELSSSVENHSIKGISFSGQMHGLVLLDAQGAPLRNAILWNDTRTTEQCREIERILGERLITIAKNKALEGFTLPKLLWVKQHEQRKFQEARQFLLPKDYVRYRLTGKLHMDYSDAAGTLLLDVANRRWSTDICEALAIPERLCPPLVDSADFVGHLLPEVAAELGLSTETKVFAGGADNACGALGAGIIAPGSTLCSVGTSGVLLSYHQKEEHDFQGKLHYFNHGMKDAWYVMGVTLAAGDSLSWFKKAFADEVSFERLLEEMAEVPPGARGLLFTPYIMGERTPYADSAIRASFIGIDSSHRRPEFTRAVLEGITFSLRDSLELMRGEGGKEIDTIVSIGGGAKNEHWLQMQADIFNATIVKLKSEQGPALGAAMLAAVGHGWYSTMEECAAVFVESERQFWPASAQVEKYGEVYEVYQQIYEQTKDINERLRSFR